MAAMTFEERIATLERFPFCRMRDKTIQSFIDCGLKTPMDYYIQLAQKNGWYHEFEFWDFENLPDDMQGVFELELRRRKESRDSKRQARIDTAKFVKSGSIIRTVCDICGDPETNAHHIPDAFGGYHAFQVRWLCPEHHMMEHRILAKKQGERPNCSKFVNWDGPEKDLALAIFCNLQDEPTPEQIRKYAKALLVLVPKS
jgi:hypothetical protein